MGLGKVEVPIRLIIVVKNKNCQAYLCVLYVFPSSPLSRRFSIFRLPPFATSSSLSWPNMAYLVFNSTASFRPVSSFNEVRSHSEARGGEKCFSLSLARSLRCGSALSLLRILRELSQPEMRLLKTIAKNAKTFKTTWRSR